MRKVIKINENELKHIIKRYIKEYIDPEGCLDDPNAGDPFGDFRSEIVADYDDNEKAAENAYSWGLLHNGNMADLESDRMVNARRHEQEWTPRQLSSADKMKDRWISGERSLEDLDDAFYGSSLDETVTRIITRIKESVGDTMGEIDNTESGDDFTYGDSIETKPGRHRQTIFYNGEQVGYLVTRERNPLAGLEEYYHIPDVEKGLSQEGWFDFKTFKDDYEGALDYVKANFDEIVYLIQNGDTD